MTDAVDRDARHCIKCGREVGPDETLCAYCNRAGMTPPSASQYHGTVAVAIVLAVAALAIAASLSMRGVGPFAGAVREITPADPGYTITFTATNEGNNAGRAKCQLATFDATGRRLRTATTITDQIPGGGSVDASVTIPGLEAAPASVTVDCS
ncbi:MAG: hypothetical protein IT341_03610 [Chloroflexi bacterium]|nr:hypothetical protein [Chloroflexota bacterium]